VRQSVPLATASRNYVRGDVRITRAAQPLVRELEMSLHDRRPPAARSYCSPANGALNQPTACFTVWNASRASGYDLGKPRAIRAFFFLIRSSSRIRRSHDLACDRTADRRARYYWRAAARNGLGEGPGPPPGRSRQPPGCRHTLLSAPSDGRRRSRRVRLLGGNTPEARLSRFQFQVSPQRSFSFLADDRAGFDTTRLTGPLADSAHYFWRGARGNSMGLRQLVRDERFYPRT